jgi:light-regulated signal transduction histidine kinase (bacteriophytochrome)
VLGGLFFGHSVPGKFTGNHEALLRGVAAQAGIAMDNARLFEQAQWVQNELKRSNEELRRANQDLETFAYSASHDLNEPLRTVAISAQLLERTCGGRLKGDEAKFLAMILQGARRMESLIQDLLSYTTATKHEDGPPPGVDSGQVLATVLENLTGQLEQAGATVTQTALPVVAMHESRLTQVLQNLVGNALKYRGAEAPRVHVSASERDGWCVLSVADNGIGIEPEFTDSIFGLFKRLHTRDQYPGSGIGLAICQRIVERYGGRIWLEKSVPGEGSTFCFSVPVRAG